MSCQSYNFREIRRLWSSVTAGMRQCACELHPRYDVSLIYIYREQCIWRHGGLLVGGAGWRKRILVFCPARFWAFRLFGTIGLDPVLVMVDSVIYWIGCNLNTVYCRFMCHLVSRNESLDRPARRLRADGPYSWGCHLERDDALLHGSRQNGNPVYNGSVLVRSGGHNERIVDGQRLHDSFK